VTQEQWEAVMGSNPSFFKSPKNPVETLSWVDSHDFLKKLSAKVGGPKFQLPTEAQWEYACRAGTKTRFYFGNHERDLVNFAWYGVNAIAGTQPVGGKRANMWGLYDMQGNVSQWCEDGYYERYYEKSPTDDPRGPAEAFYPRAVRGGYWHSYGSQCRSASRSAQNDLAKGESIGLRVARVVEEK
jgi:formylglycine-generating enzyme required for sulfatase activity